MKKLLSILTLLVTSLLFAEVDIPMEKRTKNLSSGVCVWCCIENLANIHGVNQLKGIAKYRHDNYGSKKVLINASYGRDSRGNLVKIRDEYWTTVNEAPGNPDRVHEEFKRLKVNYKLQGFRNYNMDIIKEAMKKKLGCAIAVLNYPSQGDHHMVTLTEITDKDVYFIECNGKCERYHAERRWFDQSWSGYAIIIYPPEPIITESIEISPPIITEKVILPAK